ncbi:hypothetical protein MMC14_003811 [Varicellaria rhodocarpa]|nr:hypothetical protein [Varicellaria rhodocarpa]
MLSLFIYAVAPASGGYLNPLITFSTVITGLTSFPRGALYVRGQTVGGALAGGVIRGSFGTVMALNFVAFGVGLDPRQAKLFGHLGPFLVGCTLGVMSFASAGLAPQFTGAGMNPARCFAFAVARKDFHGE